MVDHVRLLKAKAEALTNIGIELKKAEERLERNPTEANLNRLSAIRDLYLNGGQFDAEA